MVQSPRSPRVRTALVVEDDPRACAALAHLVGREGFRVETAASLAAGRERIALGGIACALLDLELPDGSGMELVRELQGSSDTEIIVLTGHGSIDTAVEALRLGVVDFLTKPLDVNRLRKLLHDVQRTLELRTDLAELRAELRGQGRLVRMAGTSAPMQKVYDLVTKVAPTTATVLILGETGTGKELVAEAIHRMSKRERGLFVPVNCAAIHASLVESELFGHEAGAFTGAAKRRKGLFEQAHGGTLFLDEVFETPLELQVKLLRALESHTITRVGGEGCVEVDVRVVAASNKTPAEVLVDKELREDLLYRLMVFPIVVPPLRERGEDIELLAQHFLDLLSELNGKIKRFAPNALAALRAHAWPGNVRELKNTVERAYILGGNEIDASALQPPAAAPVAADGASLGIAVGMSTAEGERVLIEATLEAYRGDKTRAAESLGISLKTIYNRLREYGVEKRLGGGGGGARKHKSAPLGA